MQPMAERLGVDHQRLQQFITSSTWAVGPVRGRLARRAVAVVAPQAWVVDDTGFPKDGTARRGWPGSTPARWARSATARSGCQCHAVTDTASCPLDWRLFLPERWDDAGAATPEAAAIRARRARAGIPEQVRHRPKWQLALDMLDELAGWGLRPAAGGRRRRLRRHRRVPRRPRPSAACATCCQVKSDLPRTRPQAVPEVRPYSGRGRRPKPRYRTKPVGLRELALAAGRDAAVRLTWREGSRGPLTSHFVALRVRPAGRRATARPADDGTLPEVLAARRMAPDGPRAHRLLAVQPARRHPAGRTGPAGQDPLADRARLPRTQDRPRPGPLRGPLLHRLAPPRHPRHRRPPVPHRAADQPKSGCAGLTLYAGPPRPPSTCSPPGPAPAPSADNPSTPDRERRPNEARTRTCRSFPGHGPRAGAAAAPTAVQPLCPPRAGDVAYPCSARSASACAAPRGTTITGTGECRTIRDEREPMNTRSSGPAVLDPTASRSPSAHPMSSIAPAQSVP